MVSDELEDVCTIMGTVAEIDAERLMSNSRKWPLPACRGILYIHFRKQGLTFPQIGRMFNRDHATVFAGTKRVSGWLEVKEPYVSQLFERFNQSYKNREKTQSEEPQREPVESSLVNSMI